MTTRTTSGATPLGRSLSAFLPTGYDKGRGFLWQAAWVVVQNLVFAKWWCPGGARILLLRAFGADIGRGVIVRHRVRVLWPWKLSIGNDCWIGEGAWLLNLEPVRLGNDVCISQEVFLCTGSHDRRSHDFKFDNAAITVEGGVWVAAQALVLRGVTLREDSTIGARATVTRSTQPGTLVPAGGRV